jgi:excisionase family DNA binding protein
MNIDDAVKYLNENGFSISKSSIYKHTMNGTIPFRRFGKRKLVFSANELDKWVKNNE